MSDQKPTIEILESEIAETNKKPNNKVLSVVSKFGAWIVGIFLILIGLSLATAQGMIASGLFCLLAGLLALPPIYNLIKQILLKKTGFKFTKLISLGLILVLFFLSVFSTPSTGTQKEYKDKLAKEESIKKEQKSLANQQSKDSADAKVVEEKAKYDAIKVLLDINPLLLKNINDIIRDFPKGKLNRNTDIKTSSYQYETTDFNLVFEYQTTETVNLHTYKAKPIDPNNYLYKNPEQITYISIQLNNQACDSNQEIDIKPNSLEYLAQVGVKKSNIDQGQQNKLTKNRIDYIGLDKSKSYTVYCNKINESGLVNINYMTEKN